MATTTVAGSGTASGTTRRRGWKNVGGLRRRRGAGSSIAQNKIVGAPKTKLTDMSAASGRRMAVAGAIIGEKFAHFGADIRLGFYTITHPVHPLRRVAAKERAVNVKAAATGMSFLSRSRNVLLGDD